MRVIKRRILLFAALICMIPVVAEAKLPLKVRDKDAQVKQVEERLAKLGYEIRWIDEEFGYETLRAVKDFQGSVNLPVTGVVDKRTWDKLEEAGKSGGTAMDKFSASEEFKIKDKDPRIKDLERQLVSLGYNIKWVDEEYGFETERAVKSFQKDRKMDETGKIDKETWEAIWGRGKAVPAGNTGTINSQKTQALTQEARRYIGVPYVWGGTTPSGFDCSGYVQYVFNKVGYSLPRLADAQFYSGTYVSKTGLRNGDVVFFETYEPGPSHDGIYIGSGQFIHASSSRGIMISRLDENYWSSRYLGARRFIK